MSNVRNGHLPLRRRISLTAEERDKLHDLKMAARAKGFSPEANAFLTKARILELAHIGEGLTRIARRMGCHKEVVRRVLRGYLEKGLSALTAKPGRPVDVQGRVEILAYLDLFEEQLSPASSKELRRLVNPDSKSRSAIRSLLVTSANSAP
jgi:hypothetical protein